MPENGGVDPQSSRMARAPRGLVLVGVLAFAVGLAVAANTLGERPAQPPWRSPSAEVTTPSGPTPTDSTTTYTSLVETAVPEIGGLALRGQPITTALTRSDPTAVNGAWTVVVRRGDGSLGQHGAVVTYPASTNDFADSAGARAPVRVGGVTGISGRGYIVWPLGNGQARVRGDLPRADLVHIAELTTVRAGHPQVTPPDGFLVIARLPSRLPLVHEVRYTSAVLGLAHALGDGLTYTGLTSGGGFEDALYAARGTPAGRVHDKPAVFSSVQGGNGTLAWEPSPGVVAYVGWSGATTSATSVTALQTLAEGSYIVPPRHWLAIKPELIAQENDPANR